jgi:uncharacterized protein (DUF427 family)
LSPGVQGHPGQYSEIHLKQKKKQKDVAWQYMLVIPAFRRLRQEDRELHSEILAQEKKKRKSMK